MEGENGAEGMRVASDWAARMSMYEISCVAHPSVAIFFNSMMVLVFRLCPGMIGGRVGVRRTGMVGMDIRVV